jgi:hypothetical protein
VTTEKTEQRDYQETFYMREMARFSTINFVVTGITELDICQAIDDKLVAFGGGQHGYEVINMNLSEREVGDPPIRLWHCEVAATRQMGHVSWA